jgi:hypothetical protein
MLIKNGKIKRPKNFKWTFTNWFIALFFHPNDVTFVLDSFSLFLSLADLSVEAITARTRKFLLLPRSLEKLFFKSQKKVVLSLISLLVFYSDTDPKQNLVSHFCSFHLSMFSWASFFRSTCVLRLITTVYIVSDPSKMHILGYAWIF